MEQMHTSKKTIPWLLIFAILLFAAVYLFCWQSTALHENSNLEWSLVFVFIKSYFGVILLYFLFCIRASFIKDENTPGLKQTLLSVLRTLQLCFLVAVSLQIIVNLVQLWQTLGLYPLELDAWDSLWTLIRYLIGMVGTWVLELWFWIGKQLRISFLLNNPCIGGICLEEYPWVSLVLSAMLFYIGKQLWKIAFVQDTIKFFAKLLYQILKTIWKVCIRIVSKKASSHLSSVLLIGIWKQVYGDIKSLYEFSKSEPENDLASSKIETIS